MPNGPKRAKTHSKVERTLVVGEDVKKIIGEYFAGMQSVYAGVLDILFTNYSSLIAKVASDNTMTAADRVAKSKCVEQVTQEYSIKHGFCASCSFPCDCNSDNGNDHAPYRY